MEAAADGDARRLARVAVDMAIDQVTGKKADQLLGAASGSHRKTKVDTEGATGNAREWGTASRRTQTEGDVTLPTGSAARREAMRRHGGEVSKANNFTRENVYGQSANFRGPQGEPSEVLKTKHRMAAILRLSIITMDIDSRMIIPLGCLITKVLKESVYLMREDSEKIWHLVSSIVDALKIQIRLMISTDCEPTSWSNWIAFPSYSYVEVSGSGPMKKDDVIWVEILNTKSCRRGRLIPDQEFDCREQVAEMLDRGGVVGEELIKGITRISLS